MLKASVLLMMLVFSSVYCIKTGGISDDLDLSDQALMKTLNRVSVASISQIEANRNSQRVIASSQTPLKYSLMHIMSAKSQVVQGAKYFIKIKIKEADCVEACSTEICDIEVWDRPWLNKTDLLRHECAKKAKSTNLLGGKRQISVNDTSLIQAVIFGVDRINEASNTMFKHALVSIDRASRQIVAGYNYIVEFRIGETSCLKTSVQTDQQSCKQTSDKVRSCKATIWDQPWMPERYKLTNFSCN